MPSPSLDPIRDRKREITLTLIGILCISMLVFMAASGLTWLIVDLVEILFWAAIVVAMWFILPMSGLMPDIVNRLNFRLGLQPLENPIFWSPNGREYDVYEDPDCETGPESRLERCCGTHVGFAFEVDSEAMDDSEEVLNDPNDSPYEDVQMADGGESSIATVDFGNSIGGAFPYTEDDEVLVLKDRIRPYAGKGAYELIQQAKRQTLAEEGSKASDAVYFTVLAGLSGLSLLMSTIVFFIIPAL